ncbi:MAG: tetratricopeptide repeat protein [bacterium]
MKSRFSISNIIKLGLVGIIIGIVGLTISGCGRHKPERIMQDAQIAFQQRDFVTAMIKLDDFLQRYPNDPRAAEAQYAHAMSNMNLGRFDKAINEYQQVIKKYPASSEWVVRSELDIAAAYVQQSKFAEAIGQYDKVISTYSSNTNLIPLVRFYRAGTFVQEKKWDEAVQGFTELANSNIDDRKKLDAYFQIAGIYLQTKKTAQLVATCNTMLAKFGKNEQDLFNIYSLMVQGYKADKQYSKVLDTYKIMLAKSGKNERQQYSIYWSMAEIYRATKKYPAAIETYQIITTKFTTLPRIQKAEAEFNIADSYKQLKKYKEAIAVYQSVQEQYAKDPLAQDFAVWSNVEVGSIYRKEMKDIKAAQPYYDAAIKSYTATMNNPPMGDKGKAAYAAVKLAEIYEFHLGDLVKAKEVYQAAVKNFPKAPWTEYAAVGFKRLTEDTTKKIVTQEPAAKKANKK